MGGFETFYELMKRNTFKQSILSIKNAASSIWTTDVRIIQNYTDHGVEHSERIFEKLYDLLKPDNKLNTFREEELYILILAVILHDIGMQCDIKKHPKIKRIAESKFGAKFNINFADGVANDYSQEEQNELRKNHHLLTAAWLHCGYGDDRVSHHNAFQSIEPQYREDLINVCKFHSKLDIFTCPADSRRSHIRCRYLAALLRLGDELDIDQYRADTQTVETFSFEPQNSIFWYIHANTEVFIRNPKILLKVFLTPRDYIACGDAIQEIVINTFIEKNRPLTHILAENDLNVFISDESTVEQDDYAHELPSEAQEHIIALGKMESSKIAGEDNLHPNSYWETAFMARLVDIRNTVGPLLTRYAVEDNMLKKTVKLIWDIRHQKESATSLKNDSICAIKNALCFIQSFESEDLRFLYEIGCRIHSQVVDGISQIQTECLLHHLSICANKGVPFYCDLWNYPLEQAERILWDYDCIAKFDFDSVTLSEGYVYKKTSGQLLAVSVRGEAYKVFVWNLSHGIREPVAVLGGLYECVYKLRICQDGEKNLVIGKGTRRIYVWDLTVTNQPICIFEHNAFINDYTILRSVNGNLYALAVTTRGICVWDFLKQDEPIEYIKGDCSKKDVFIVNTRMDCSGVSYDLLSGESDSKYMCHTVWEIKETSTLEFQLIRIIDKKRIFELLPATDSPVIDSYRILPHKKILGILTEEMLMLYNAESNIQLAIIPCNGQRVVNFAILEHNNRIYVLEYFLWNSSRQDGELVRCYSIRNGEIEEVQQWFQGDGDIANGVMVPHEDKIMLYFNVDYRGTIFTTSYNQRNVYEFHKLPETLHIINMTRGGAL